MRGCVAYDCFGAGQHVTQDTLARRDWRESPGTAARMFRVFEVMRQLHELAWDLVEALALTAARPVHAKLRAALDGVEVLTREPADALLAADVAGRREAIGALLGEASELARADVERRRVGRERARRGADLAGADLRGRDLQGTNLRGALLSARTCVGPTWWAGGPGRGGPPRRRLLRGADLRGALFVTGSQLESAAGDGGSPPGPLGRPAHWGG